MKKKKLKRRNKLVVSVVMPVYNAGDFLMDSIESILSQSLQDFEFIIVDDLSSDGSWELIKKYAKRYKKLKVFRNKKHLGVSETVKLAIQKSRGRFIARMDADDIAIHYRLKTQLNYLLSNPKVVALGGQCQVINAKGEIIGRKEFPTDFEDIYKYIFKFVPVQQPTLMIAKKRLPKDFLFYRDGMNTAEEVELFFKLFQYGKVENLPQTLLKYRIHSNNTSLKNLRQTFLLTLLARIKAVLVYGYIPTVSGVLTTLAQFLIVIFLPHKTTLWLYEKIRNLFSLNKEILVRFRLAKIV